MVGIGLLVDHKWYLHAGRSFMYMGVVIAGLED